MRPRLACPSQERWCDPGESSFAHLLVVALKDALVEARPTAQYIMECLRQVTEIHSLNLRIKDPEHLLAKVIRKKIERREFVVARGSDRSQGSDLSGVRVLHLVK